MIDVASLVPCSIIERPWRGGESLEEFSDLIIASLFAARHPLHAALVETYPLGRNTLRELVAANIDGICRLDLWGENPVAGFRPRLNRRGEVAE